MKQNMYNPRLGEMAGGYYTRTFTSADGIVTNEKCAIQGPVVKIDNNDVWIEGWNRTIRIQQSKAYVVKTKR